MLYWPTDSLRIPWRILSIRRRLFCSSNHENSLFLRAHLVQDSTDIVGATIGSVSQYPFIMCCRHNPTDGESTSNAKNNKNTQQNRELDAVPGTHSFPDSLLYILTLTWRMFCWLRLLLRSAEAARQQWKVSSSRWPPRPPHPLQSWRRILWLLLLQQTWRTPCGRASSEE